MSQEPHFCHQNWEFLVPFPLVDEIWILPTSIKPLGDFWDLTLVCNYIENLDQHNSEVWFCEILVLSVKPRRSLITFSCPYICVKKYWRQQI